MGGCCCDGWNNDASGGGGGGGAIDEVVGVDGIVVGGGTGPTATVSGAALYARAGGNGPMLGDARLLGGGGVAFGFELESNGIGLRGKLRWDPIGAGRVVLQALAGDRLALQYAGAAGVPLSLIFPGGVNPATGQALRVASLSGGDAVFEWFTPASATPPALSAVLGVGNSAANIKITTLGAPTAPQDAATKGYVDTTATATLASADTAADAGDAATLVSAKAYADAGDAATLASANTYTNAAVAGAVAPGLTPVLTASNSAGGLKITALGTPTAATDAATKGYVDTRPAPPADTLTAVLTAGNSAGNLKITTLGAPTLPADAATKGYVDGRTLTNVLVAGASAGGFQITTLGAPTVATDAATKGYVDTTAAATLVSADTAADAGDAATLASAKSYADAGDAATLVSADAAADAGDAATLASANAYTNAAVAGVGTPALSAVLAAGNSAGGLKIVSLGTPTAATDAATKGYVDTRPAPPADTLAAVLTAGNSAGNLKITTLGTPTAATDAATKGYVDARASVGTSKLNASNGTGGWADTSFTVVGGDELSSPTGFAFTSVGGGSFAAQGQDEVHFDFAGPGPFEINGAGAFVFTGAGGGGTFEATGVQSFIMAGTGTGEALVQNFTQFKQIVIPGGFQEFSGGARFSVTHPTVGESLRLEPATASSKAAGRFLSWDGAKNLYAEAVPALSVTSGKLADGAVTVTKIADGSVTGPKLASAAVTNLKIADGSVSPLKLAPVWRELKMTGSAVTVPDPFTLTIDQTVGTWPALVGGAQPIPTTGWYRISAECRVTSTSTAEPLRRYIYPTINGVQNSAYPLAAGDRYSAIATNEIDLCGIGRSILLTAGDLLLVSVGSGTLSIVGSAAFVRIEFLGGP